MCGIFAYTGEKRAAGILIDGLRVLEYRGYDSAGIYTAGSSAAVRAVGTVRNVADKAARLTGTSGIAHTRWATHGAPSEKNAHPHTDCNKSVWIVHNGIIENYKKLRERLTEHGHSFASETDSEVLAHLIEEHMKALGNDFEASARAALKEITGTYGVALMHKSLPGTVITARMGSPIVIGIGSGEYFIASDPTPILHHTKDVVYLNDGEFALISKKGYTISTLDNAAIERIPSTIEWNIDDVKKGGFEHFMLKEIIEEPEVILNAIRGRLVIEEGLAQLGGLREVEDKLAGIKRLVIVGCGSAYYAGVVGKYMLEEYAGIPTEVEIGSELRYRKMLFDEETAIIGISQSGETADTLAAIKEAQRKGVMTLGIVNAVGSTIARETEAGVYNHAGPEIGVASTKAFLSQLSVLALFTLFLGRQRDMSPVMGKRIAEELLLLPGKVERILNDRERIRTIAHKYEQTRDFLYIGRKYNSPIAYEGALKLKEVSYIHAEGYGAGEMKHGPLAMIDEAFPTFAIAPKDSVYEKMISNIEEIKARKGRVIALATEGDMTINEHVDDVIYMPKTLEMLSPILSVVPLQLFAYYIATARGFNVDRPRNLAKSVTVE
ncbi:MAG: glucosamine--fructose-6-phosphate aminotransferase (isomerizing) [Parcubacteria group bacterium Gr01-1014_48]|nr:MAG: glucosamine--fructose-6-phosphate aminotransferase (isomerizing) [Parcubacteria group bacterium Greene0416_14]TSC74291.1 MAG: glucosamine--fructose-6-phosphate aminotransferase (isomerizing) [Parcubacteria group bacterium Gr01-1014_48]TSC99122.1 MAG: glucosamine--fructose-6-phosphate aminotransferase (isomerizing) [Parcubacteria group bacterium Greene1014_15]TSD06698.1 MAG: glucosamine--fructose-6-phosphate aminotransferase (isomerizing) [Parcubacteria group bacterium Greene0714_4]